MNKGVELYFKELIGIYGEEVSLSDPEGTNNKLEQIPVPLRSLYKFTSSVKLPFGEIFDIDKALMQSERMPFKPNWFVFGNEGKHMWYGGKK